MGIGWGPCKDVLSTFALKSEEFPLQKVMLDSAILRCEVFFRDTRIGSFTPLSQPLCRRSHCETLRSESSLKLIHFAVLKMVSYW